MEKSLEEGQFERSIKRNLLQPRPYKLWLHVSLTH